MVTRILTIVSGILALALGAMFIYLMYDVVTTEDQILEVEGEVIQKLELIREAQDAHAKVTGHYTGSWDTLRTFVAEGEFPIVQVKETIITLAYGADSVVIERDTLGYASVKDSLFTPEELTFLDLENISRVPHPYTDTINFVLKVDRIDRSGHMVDVILVEDPYPFDKRRSYEEESPIRQPLRFGSLEEISTASNWE